MSTLYKYCIGPDKENKKIAQLQRKFRAFAAARFHFL